jgi:hypothetical protein
MGILICPIWKKECIQSDCAWWVEQRIGIMDSPPHYLRGCSLLIIASSIHSLDVQYLP